MSQKLTPIGFHGAPFRLEIVTSEMRFKAWTKAALSAGSKRIMSDDSGMASLSEQSRRTKVERDHKHSALILLEERKSTLMKVKRLEALFVLLAASSLLAAEVPQLGDPPPAPKPEAVWRLQQQVPAAYAPGTSFNVNIASREEVRNFFNTVYMASYYAAMGWNGNVTNCTAGTTSASFRDLVVLRINYFRAMAGVPSGVMLNDTWNSKDQKAALIMSANNALSHSPSSSWTCYTAEGAEGAGNSNLALGSSGPEAIDGYMEDWGSSNYPIGHRRWILYPQTQTMGTGDLPAAGANYAANATWVFDGHYGGTRPATRDGYVAWPPPGFVPYQVVYPRWSFSYPNANFGSASVTLSSNGVNVPVTLETVANGYGENTLVWHPSNLSGSNPYIWPRPASNVVYGVSVQNVVIGGSPRTFNYTVTIFDPAVTGPDTVLPSVAGPDQPTVNYSNLYSFTTVSNATGYQWRQSQRMSFTAVEGAENGLKYFTTNTSPGYSVVVSSPRYAGSYAFHLAHPTPPMDQVLTYTRLLLPGTNSQMQFRSRLGYATANQVANVQVSLDEGNAWEDVYRQPGTDGSGEGSFNARTVWLTNYIGRSILVRFRYVHTGGSYYYQTSSGMGWYLDSISFSNTEELTNSVTSDVLAGNAFVFSPTQATNYGLQVRAEVYDDFYLEWGPVKRVTATASLPPVMQFAGGPSVVGNQVQMEFTVANYRTGMTFHLLKASSPQGSWSIDPSASFQTVIPNARFRATTTTGGASRAFYRVTSSY